MSRTKEARAPAAALVAAALLLAPAARGQVSSNARSAQLLFDEARALSQKGDYAAACPKFVQSQRLDPAGGTILHAADCHESEGKIALAWSEYNEALSFAIRDKRADREKIARERIAALASRIGKLSLDVDAETRRLEGLTIEIDDSKVARAAWDVPVPIDKGPHVVKAHAPGRAAFTAEITTEDGRVATLRIPRLVRAPEQGAAAKPAPATPPPPPSDDPGKGRRTIGVVVGGAGLVGLGIGAFFGIRAASTGDQSDQCTLGPAGNGCPREAVDKQDEARTDGTVSTIAFVAGGALLAAGAVLYLTAPKSASTRTGIAALPTYGGGALLMNGSF